MNTETRTDIEAAVFRRLLSHLDSRKDVQNLDLMNLSGFCRNCLAKWYSAEAQDRGEDISVDSAKEFVYGMTYDEWKQNSSKNGSKSTTVLSLADLDQVSDLLQEEIVHNFIITQTKQALSYSKLQNIFELMRSESNLWELRLSQEWKIIKSGKELLVQQNSEK